MIIYFKEYFMFNIKFNSNDIGYFHQNTFKYIKGCTVPINEY